MYKTIDACRVCGNQRLEPILDLGVQALTGVFPKTAVEDVPTGPLLLVKCHGSNVCGLVQLADSFDIGSMYGDNYGYRSGLNATMVQHLNRKIADILERFEPPPGSLVLDIGSNDGTTLSAYPEGRFRLVGVDPTAGKFRSFYPAEAEVVEDFFTASSLDSLGGQQASIITSFSMLYDLEDPIAFMVDVRDVLAPDGVWVFEQSYLPLMLERNSYDTVCHEHLEYYSLAQVSWMAAEAGLRITNVEFNDVNGGSFSIEATRSDNPSPVSPRVRAALDRESAHRLEDLETFRRFASRVSESRTELRGFVARARERGQVIGGLGASTKGNVLLQYCGITARDVIAIGEINSDKFGSYTPGSRIPIIPERDLMLRAPEYLLVLPWHFRETFEAKDLPEGSQLVFPLPNLRVVKSQ